MSRCWISSIVLMSLAAAPTARSAAAADYVPTPQDSICNPGDLLESRWKPPQGQMLTVRVYFNTSLDPVLDGAANPGHIKGDEDDRKTVFLKAITDWNAVLADVNASVRLEGDTTYLGGPEFTRDLWAADQTPFLCDEQDSMGVATGHKVYNRDYTNHMNDNRNVVSTGHNHNGANLDTLNNPIGAGWIAGDKIITFSTDLLGETHIRTNAMDDSCMEEVDIVWFTHFENSNPACQRIAWDYTGPAVACGMDKLEPNYFDYYTVILHELGHLLGLDHFQHGNPDCHNVMFGMTFPRERQIITSKERACLAKLYGRPAAGSPELPPPQLQLTVAPNPFSGTTRIDCAPLAGRESSLDVFNPAGERVRNLLTGVLPGPVTVSWDGRDDRGQRLPAGVYFIRFLSGSVTQRERVVFIRN